MDETSGHAVINETATRGPKRKKFANLRELSDGDIPSTVAHDSQDDQTTIAQPKPDRNYEPESLSIDGPSLNYSIRFNYSSLGQPSCPIHCGAIKIVIICALPLEVDAIEALFDRHWDDDVFVDSIKLGDPNAYSAEVLGRHNVVVAHLPKMGTSSAAVVASSCRATFPNIQLALVVGICGGIPLSSNGQEMILGDVVVSDGIIEYDFGRRLPDQFLRKDDVLDSLGPPIMRIRTLLSKLKSLRSRQNLERKMVEYMEMLRDKSELAAKYPGVMHDNLFESIYHHADAQRSCSEIGCNGKSIVRERLKCAVSNIQPAVHFGLIASGNTVMKSGEDRDRIARDDGVIAFEMEGAGVWSVFPCVVIKGICDYADSHKSKEWQRYSAATAAACAKAFLSYWAP